MRCCIIKTTRHAARSEIKKPAEANVKLGDGRSLILTEKNNNGGLGPFTFALSAIRS